MRYWLLRTVPYLAVLGTLMGSGDPHTPAKLIDIFSAFLVFGMLRIVVRNVVDGQLLGKPHD